MGANEFKLSDVSEYFSRGRMTVNVPVGCAVKKTVYIARNQETVAKMDAKIADLEKYLSECDDKTLPEYEKSAKQLAVCKRIKRDCLDGIERTKKHIEIERRSYHR